MDTVTAEQVAWAKSYDAPGRLSNSPSRLTKLIRPAQNSFREHQQVPEWAGVELLRGWAYILASDITPGARPPAEWLAVLDALTQHQSANPADRPPRPCAPVANLSPDPRLSTQSKMHRDPAFLAAKKRRLQEPHVAPINAFVDRIREERGAFVPYVDPDSGGVDAHVLFVLESPARPASHGSGMLSPDNDDGTAANLWRAYDLSKLPRVWGLHWNAVPWFVGNDTHEKNVTGDQVTGGHAYLLQLLDLAPKIRVIVAMGRPAQASVHRLDTELERREIKVLDSLHPSPRNTSRGIPTLIPDVLCRARGICEGEPRT